MRNATRTILIGLVAIVGLSSMPTAIATDEIPVSRVLHEMNLVSHQPAVPQLEILTASARQRQQVDAAMTLFENAGLELPPLIIHFSDDTDVCEGNLGTYRPQPDNQPAIVSVCSKMRITLIHELAHAWDRHALTDERRQLFMRHWNLDNWNDRSESWYDRGSERAADTIAYTLLLTEPTDNPDMLRYVCGYSILTGLRPPGAVLKSCFDIDDDSRDRFEASFQHEPIPERGTRFEQRSAVSP